MYRIADIEQAKSCVLLYHQDVAAFDIDVLRIVG
jgi:hypothetical protein